MDSVEQIGGQLDCIQNYQLEKTAT